MKKLLALLLALAMVFSLMACLTACDSEDGDDDDDKTSDEDKDKDEDDDEDDDKAELYGKWKGTIDFSDNLNMILENQVGEESVAYLKVEKFDLVVIFEFSEDGEYTMTIDGDALEETLKEQIPLWVEGYEQALEDRGVEVSDFEENMGMTIGEYLEDNLLGSLSGLAEGTEGEFELDGNKLYMDGDEEYIEIEVTSKKLQFVSYSGEDEGFAETFGNMTFKRQ